MSHVTEFAIAGLAGRKSTIRYVLNRDVNVFFGHNGSGKTSLLKILQSAMTGDASTLESVSFEWAEVKIFSVERDTIYTRRIEKKNVDGLSEAKRLRDEIFGEDEGVGMDYVKKFLADRASLQWTIRPKLPKEFPGRWRHRYLPTSRLYLGGSSYRKVFDQKSAVSEEKLDMYFAQSLQEIWSAYSSEILNAVRQAQEDGLVNILKAVLSSNSSDGETQEVDVDTAYARASAFLQRQNSRDTIGSQDMFERRCKSNPQLRSVVSDINEVEKRIENATAPRVKIQNMIETMFAGNKTITFGDSSIDILGSSNQSIGLNTLSSGEKHLLRILIEALRAGVSSAIIDEPEISLHIDWQRQLINAITSLNPHAQLILATHSPEVMADVDDSKIFRI